MKFRTDFVTNSSDSSFLTFNVKNKKLFECLTRLGIKIEDVEEGELSDNMRIILPSGESNCIEVGENWNMPYITDCNSISAWIISLILGEVEDSIPAKEEDEYSDFTKELIELLNKADITHLDWEAVESWSRDEMIADLDEALGAFDSEIEDATIEHTYGFEGEVGPCIYAEVHNGKRMLIDYSNTEDAETMECDGLKFVVTGKLKYYENRDAIVEYIEDQGGTVSNSVSKNTDYLICNDIKASSSKMEKAKELGIPVLTELAFIRMFADVEEFMDEIDEDSDDRILEEEDLYDDAWDVACDGGVLDFFVDNGLGPIVMEVWKDGKWCRK